MTDHPDDDNPNERATTEKVLEFAARKTHHEFARKERKLDALKARFAASRKASAGKSGKKRKKKPSRDKKRRR